MPASRVNDPRTQGAALLASYPPRHRPGFDERLAAWQQLQQAGVPLPKTASGRTRPMAAKQLEATDTSANLCEEMEDLEQAARTIWKDETGELSALQASLKVVEAQVKIDKIEAFSTSMGAFATQASERLSKVKEQHTKADEGCKALKAWFGEDAKTEPEELFSTLNNFVLTFQKAHKYNKDRVEKKERDARMAAAKAAGKAAARGAAQRKNLVDNVEDGTAGRAARQRRQTHGSAGTASMSGAPPH